jgi:N-acetylglucosaminyldiphosphoundecaprenol N-acetyl-beta-D-mannosaminyltransferase
MQNYMHQLRWVLDSILSADVLTDVRADPAELKSSNNMTDELAVAKADSIPQVRVGELTVCSIRQDECVDFVIRELDASRGGWIITANIDHLMRYRRSPEFREMYGSASMIVADGMPLVWASRLQGTPLPERVAGSDLIHSLSRAAALHGKSVFLLGGNPGSAEKAAVELEGAASGLQVSGIACPPMGFENDADALRDISNQLKSSKADIVFVALGSPKQEWFINKMRDALPNAWWIGVGISFSFVSGEVVRAPRWLQRLGLEWLHRLCQEPGRLWSRYLIHGPPCAIRLLTQSLWRRWFSS